MKYVYIDMLFFINFFIDFSLLVFTAIYCSRKIIASRLFYASITGAMYGVAWVVYFDLVLYSIIGKLLFSLFLIRIAFPFVNSKVYFQTMITFYVINFVTAGAILTLQLLLLSNKDVFTHWITLGEHNVWLLEATATSIVIGIPIAYLAVKNMWLYIKKISWQKSYIINCRIFYNGNVTRFCGLLDTGNQLVDPMTLHPVSIVELKVLKELLPAFASTIYANESLNMLTMVDLMQLIQDNDASTTFTIVPYQALGSTNHYLLAFRPELIILETKEGDLYIKNCLIAITNQRLSSTEMFSGIIHPQLLDGKVCTREEQPNECLSKEIPHCTEA